MQCGQACSRIHSRCRQAGSGAQIRRLNHHVPSKMLIACRKKEKTIAEPWKVGKVVGKTGDSGGVAGRGRRQGKEGGEGAGRQGGGEGRGKEGEGGR